MKTNRSIGDEILTAIQDIQQGKGQSHTVSIPDDVKRVRQGLQLSQTSFSALMGISLRTLQEWEQGRRKPRGPAISLLRIAQKHPEAFVDLHP